MVIIQYHIMYYIINLSVVKDLATIKNPQNKLETSNILNYRKKNKYFIE